jgi:hypothetical protein
MLPYIREMVNGEHGGIETFKIDPFVFEIFQKQHPAGTNHHHDQEIEPCQYLKCAVLTQFCPFYEK